MLLKAFASSSSQSPERLRQEVYIQQEVQARLQHLAEKTKSGNEKIVSHRGRFQIDKINRIRRARGQGHPISQTLGGYHMENNQANNKVTPCAFYNKNSCLQNGQSRDQGCIIQTCRLVAPKMVSHFLIPSLSVGNVS